MTAANRARSKTWNQWNRLFQSIRAEKKRNKVEKHFDKVDDWRLGEHAIDEQTLANLVSILNDEVNRKKEQLRNKPGRQMATDWFKSLKNHANRMSSELAVLQSVADADDKQCKALQETIGFIRQSLELSTQLVVVDQDQIAKRQAAGEIELDRQDAELIEFSKNVLNTAKSLLEHESG